MNKLNTFEKQMVAFFQDFDEVFYNKRDERGDELLVSYGQLEIAIDFMIDSGSIWFMPYDGNKWREAIYDDATEKKAAQVLYKAISYGLQQATLPADITDIADFFKKVSESFTKDKIKKLLDAAKAEMHRIDEEIKAADYEDEDLDESYQYNGSSRLFESLLNENFGLVADKAIKAACLSLLNNPSKKDMKEAEYAIVKYLHDYISQDNLVFYNHEDDGMILTNGDVGIEKNSGSQFYDSLEDFTNQQDIMQRKRPNDYQSPSAIAEVEARSFSTYVLRRLQQDAVAYPVLKELADRLNFAENFKHFAKKIRDVFVMEPGKFFNDKNSTDYFAGKDITQASKDAQILGLKDPVDTTGMHQAGDTIVATKDSYGNWVAAN